MVLIGYNALVKVILLALCQINLSSRPAYTVALPSPSIAIGGRGNAVQKVTSWGCQQPQSRHRVTAIPALDQAFRRSRSLVVHRATSMLLERAHNL